MSLNLVTLLYLFASVCFIQALKGLSHPTTSIRGNVETRLRKVREQDGGVVATIMAYAGLKLIAL